MADFLNPQRGRKGRVGFLTRSHLCHWSNLGGGKASNGTWFSDPGKTAEKGCFEDVNRMMFPP
jgi:hypothetical protein